jgi:hypothetical protein
LNHPKDLTNGLNVNASVMVKKEVFEWIKTLNSPFFNMIDLT